MRPLDRSAVVAPPCLSQYHHGTHLWDKDHPTAAHRAEIWQALDALQRRFCAYCEGPFDQFGHHIEHFRRRDGYPALTFAWANLLGSCDRDHSCGQHKDNKAGPYDPNDLIDPSGEDPDHFFRFIEDGTISLRAGLTASERRRASETIRVLGLDVEGNGLPQLRRDAIRSYQARDPGIVEAIMSFSDDHRRELVEHELAETAGDPFSTVVRHFLEGLD